ncbi:MAG: metallophosphoesterase family protein [Planctomycetota bacterium]|nr:metallophosphoesterase family protein [Planctomycetota bacterium]
MKVAVISDIHGNFDALEAVLADLDKRGYDLLVCLGDVVGYGAEPNECVEALRERNARVLAGNHDHAATGLLNLEFFNEYAKLAAEWTREQLSSANVEFLRSAPFVEHYPGFCATHSTLHSPELFNYILTLLDARLTFDVLDKPVCFIGHSHMAVTFFSTDPITYSMSNIFEVSQELKMVVNVGSVGQPRDEIPMASYAIYDCDERVIQMYRTEYDIERAARKILDSELPEILALRLFQGR